MKLHRLQLRGFSDAFPGVVDIPFRAIPPGLIAIRGLNGNGKTSLLEASGPAAIYRVLPSKSASEPRSGEDPVAYARGRDSFIDLEYAIDGVGAFRSRLNLDGPKRATDATLEAILSDGTRAPLNNGQRSTYDQQVAARFPSIDLFLNSAFTVQGRGDEFTRRKPSQRKDLVVEALALEHYLAKAKVAGEAADLCDDARLRLEARVEQLQKETAPALLEQIERQADDLQARGGAAEIQKRELAERIATLEAREKLSADAIAAFAAAQLRVQACDRELATRKNERLAAIEQHKAASVGLNTEIIAIDAKRDRHLADVARQRRDVTAALDRERDGIRAKRDTAVADIDAKLAGNAQIRGMAAEINEAVRKLPDVDAELVAARVSLESARSAQRTAAEQLREAERALAALLPVEQSWQRATSDANLLLDVPCGGEGEYAACQFLVNANKAKGEIGTLAAQLRPKLTLADQVATLTRAGDAHAQTVNDAQGRIRALEVDRAKLTELTKYDAPLKAADARVEQLQTQRTETIASANDQIFGHEGRTESRLLELDVDEARIKRDAGEQLDDAQRRASARLSEIEKGLEALEQTVMRLTAERSAAQADLEAAAAGNTQATQLQADLVAARADRDQVLTTLATVASGREQLEQRRADIATKREQLAVVTDRLRRIQQELVEWRDLQKALGKGGLPDLEIDAAGPTITDLTNTLLQASFGPRFSLQLVTQIPKADGSGYKDEFTVLVLDNENPQRGWKDLYFLSGGQRVVVQEALMCAFCIYTNERSSLPIRTLWRDESGAALDVENAPRYVAMLRKVRELGGFQHVLFISHNLEAAALADVQILCGDGTARLVYPPFLEAA